MAAYARGKEPWCHTHELAWAAGFFDGEGSIGAYGRNGDGKKGHFHLSLSVSQVHPFALRRFRRAVGWLGSVNGPEKVKGNRSPKWRFRVGAFEEVQMVVCLMWPWLGPVKREQAKKALLTWRLRPRAKTGRPLGRRPGRRPNDVSVSSWN